MDGSDKIGTVRTRGPLQLSHLVFGDGPREVDGPPADLRPLDAGEPVVVPGVQLPEAVLAVLPHVAGGGDRGGQGHEEEQQELHLCFADSKSKVTKQRRNRWMKI